MSNTRAVRRVFVMEIDGFCLHLSPSTLVLTDQISLQQFSIISYIYQPFRRLDNGLSTGSNFAAN